MSSDIDSMTGIIEAGAADNGEDDSVDGGLDSYCEGDAAKTGSIKMGRG